MNNNNKSDVPIILLVDNEPDNTSILSMGLEDEGFRVDYFNDPVLALSSFRPNFYSLLILDINMPKMNGYELYNEIKKLDAEVKVCFLTGSEVYVENLRRPTEEILGKCFIPKPVSIEDFVRNVRRQIEPR